MVLKIYKALLWIQGLYTLLTALWALIDIDSFMAVTGPKTDIWLVKTVAVVLLAVALSLLSGIFFYGHAMPVIILAAVNSLGLAFIDFYYAAKGTISKIYMLDGIAEILFVLGWLYIMLNMNKLKNYG